MPNDRALFVNGSKNISGRRLQGSAGRDLAPQYLRTSKERDCQMTRKMMIAAACAAIALSGSGIANADPAPSPAPAPGPVANGPKCWVDNGHRQLTPCGWAYSDKSGWYQVPWGFQAM